MRNGGYVEIPGTAQQLWLTHVDRPHHELRKAVRLMTTSDRSTVPNNSGERPSKEIDGPLAVARRTYRGSDRRGRPRAFSCSGSRTKGAIECGALRPLGVGVRASGHGAHPAAGSDTRMYEHSRPIRLYVSRPSPGTICHLRCDRISPSPQRRTARTVGHVPGRSVRAARETRHRAA